MQKVCLQRGLDIPISGEAQKIVSNVGGVCSYSIDPNQFVGITPKMLVKEGDEVKKGSPLFRDKTFDTIMGVSPVCGIVTKIERGERRKVLSIHIEKSISGATVDFKDEVSAVVSGEDIKSLLQKSGYWLYIQQRPYACVALPTRSPNAIFVSTFDSAPLAPNYNFILRGKSGYLQNAIDMLSKLAPVYVGLKYGVANTEFSNLKNCTLYEVEGAHPAGNVSVQINHIRPMAKGDTIWCISIYDLALMGKFFETGEVDFDRIVALTGPMVYSPQYYKVSPGVSVSEITSCNLHKGCSVCIVDGSPITGRVIKETDSVSYTMNQITVLDDGVDNHEFMGWLMPRFSTFNAHFTDPAKFFDCRLMQYLFGRKRYDWDARLKGGRRPIIVSNEYEKVFPMDIFPEQLIKSMIAGNIDKMEQLGACEVAPEDFALCEYVCTSKMPLQAIVRKALDNLRKEVE